MPFTPPARNVRNWVVEVDWLDSEPVVYGPYTKAAAEKAEARIRRFLTKKEREGEGITEGGDYTVGRYPIHQWGLWDEQ